jgi:hypothetical protein
MGEAKRRRQWRTDMINNVEGMATETEGAIEVEILMWDEVPRMTFAALRGDAHAARLLRCVVSVAEQVDSAPPDKLVLCGDCPTEIPRGDRSYRTCVVSAEHADKADKQFGVTFTLCAKCAEGDPLPAALRVVRKYFMPDAHELKNYHPEQAGHA